MKIKLYTVLLCIMLFGCQSTKNDLNAEYDVNTGANNKLGFIEILNANLKRYLEANIASVYEQRTDYWSLQPIRMFWQCAFVSNEERKANWELAFQDSALSNKAIERFINTQVDEYNQASSPNDRLNYVRLQPYNTADILSEQTFNMIKDNELDVWSSSIWFVPLFGAILCCFIHFINPMTYFCVIVSGVVEAVISLIINLLFSDTTPLIIGNITSCYLDYINGQNIMAQIFM